MPTTFKHSGDMGDIVFSLPAVRALVGIGGGAVLYLDPEGGASEPLVQATTLAKRTRLNEASIAVLAPLLRAQPYIQDVRPWRGEAVDCNLDAFRRFIQLNNVADMHLAAFQVPQSCRDAVWLFNIDPIEDTSHYFVISRSVRQHGNHYFWEKFIHENRTRCVFVGLPKEHEIFEYTFGKKIDYRSTETILDLARVIAGVPHFVGNSSLPHAVAEGMKRPLTAELCRVIPRIVFNRPSAKYV